MNVCAFTSVCEEDRGWIDQYLAEMERLALPFAVHLDRCSNDTMLRFIRHPQFVCCTEQHDRKTEFTEQHKQDVLDAVAGSDCGWALAVDIDETFEADAPARLAALGNTTVDLITARWLNLWGDRDHVRVDQCFAESHRVKLYNLRSGRWVFDHPITNGAKLTGKAEPSVLRSDLVCLHWGNITQEQRLFHKARWDRIYSTALRGDLNPYGYWKMICDESIKPVLIKHGYFNG